MNWKTKLESAWQINNSLLCLGIDDPSLDHQQLLAECAPYLCAVKVNVAPFYQQPQKLVALTQHIKAHYPELFLIIDSKRGDITVTAEQYCKEGFGHWHGDGMTINPYLGKLACYEQREDKAAIYLCRTSNPESDALQNLPLASGDKLYQHIGRSFGQNAMLVVGATQTDAVASIRQALPTTPLLTPGIGAQGGSLQGLIQMGLNANETGLVIPVTRAICYAKQPASAAASLCFEINRLRESWGE